MFSTLSAQNNFSLEERYPHLTKNYTIAIHPIYLYNGGMRLDVEKRIGNTPAWLQAGVTGHFLSRKNDKYNYWTLAGGSVNYLLSGGLDLNYKRFFNKKESFYLAGGCSYSHYNIEYYDKYLVSYPEDNLVYYRYKYGNLKQNINKLGLNLLIGYQSPRPAFLFDIFAGLGYRRSFKKNKEIELFDDYMIAFGYSGVVFITGVRFGVKFKHK
jgi:hypothetical protein